MGSGQTPKRDYMGNIGDDSITYSGHKGVDIDIPNFRNMDNNSTQTSR